MNESLNSNNQSLVSRWCDSSSIDLNIIPITLKNSPFTVDSRISIAAYGRIYAMSIFEEPFVYFDSDLLAQENWDSIFFELDSLVSNRLALLATFEPNLASEHVLNQARKLAGKKYFNSGVLGINPQQINSAKLISEVIAVNEKYDELHFWAYDQDVLNYLYLNKVQSLSDVFNRNFWRNSSTKGIILHFDGFFKPWRISRLAFILYFLIVFLFDVRDIRNGGKLFFRSIAILKYKKMEFIVRKEIIEFRQALRIDSSNKSTLESPKPITILKIFMHVRKRLRGNDSFSL